MEIILVFVLFFNVGKLITSPIDVFPGYVIILAALPFFLLKLKSINKKVLFVLFIVTFSGISGVIQGKNDSLNFLKIYTSILLFSWFYWVVFRHFKLNVVKVFNLYLTGAYLIALIGLLQVFTHLVGIRFGYDYSWLPLEGVRSYGDDSSGLLGLYVVHSLYGEPAHFAHGMAPAYFSAMFHLAHPSKGHLSKSQNLIIITATLLSSSFIAYLMLSISLVLVILKHKSKIVRIVFTVISTQMLLIIGASNDRVMERLNVLADIVKGNTTLNITQTDLTGGVLILVNNANITYKSIMDSPLFGGGLGSYKHSYLMHSELPKRADEYLMNFNDAGSLFLRISSELGLFGIIVTSMVLLRYRNTSFSQNNSLWIINTGAFLMILSYLIRQGHYFAYGLPLFVILYIFSCNEKFKPKRNLH